MIEMKRNDTSPLIAATLTDAAGPIDLSAAAGVQFHLRTAAGEVVVNAAATIVDAAAGEVEYGWQAGDTATAGRFEFEFEITFLDGSILTVPNTGYEQLVIVPDVA